MKKLFLTLIVAFATVCGFAQENRKIHCHIEGTVSDSTYTEMLLAPACSDWRVVDCDTIPVSDGKFIFDLYVDVVMPYELVAMKEINQGSWFSCCFFAEEGTVNVTFYNYEDDRGPDMRSESPANKRLLQFEAVSDSMKAPLYLEADSLERNGLLYSARMAELEGLINATKDDNVKSELIKEVNALYKSGAAFTPEYYAFQAKSEAVEIEYETYVEEFIRSDRTIVGLYLLRRKAMWSSDALKDSLFIALFTDVYQPLFPSHPLSMFMKTWIESRGIKVGNRYIDFTAPALDGTLHTLSKEIDGKIALIDLWASWCGSCRRISMSMIPLYEAYKDKGFTVVGVAREEERENMEHALSQDGYPWLNLLELHDENRIWSKYGVSNAGGITVLVDRDGTILAIHPTAEEVERILQEKL